MEAKTPFLTTDINFSIPRDYLFLDIKDKNINFAKQKNQYKNTVQRSRDNQFL